MGCASSKQAQIDGRTSPFHHRSYSLPVGREFEDHYAVASTISKLGSLQLDNCNQVDKEMVARSSNDTAMLHEIAVDELSKAKAWSQMMERIIAKTPSVTPPNEPEVINAWELMEGLEDAGSPLFATAYRSFSFSTRRAKVSDYNSAPTAVKEMSSSSPDNSVFSEFDSEILSSFTKALEEPSPQHQLFLQSPEMPKMVPDVGRQSVDTDQVEDDSKDIGLVKARVMEFQQKIDARRHKSKSNSAEDVLLEQPVGKGKVVFYFTSIRGVRKTYEDCGLIRTILKGYGVWVDERDVSMHLEFKNELNEILGPGFGGNSLPRVFADGKYLGGAEEVRQLHEIGELGKLLESCEMSFQKGDIAVPCEGCADVRFIPCDSCSGSCKVYVEDEEDQEGQLGCFRRCPDCNENGLVRCQFCC